MIANRAKAGDGVFNQRVRLENQYGFLQGTGAQAGCTYRAGSVRSGLVTVFDAFYRSTDPFPETVVVGKQGEDLSAWYVKSFIDFNGVAGHCVIRVCSCQRKVNLPWS